MTCFLKHRKKCCYYFRTSQFQDFSTSQTSEVIKPEQHGCEDLCHDLVKGIQGMR